MPVETIVLTVLLGVLLAYGVLLYNGLVSLKHNVRRAWANIDVLLKQRHDELPKLVEVCRQYMRHEQDTLARVTEARASVFAANQRNGFLAAAQRWHDEARDFGYPYLSEWGGRPIIQDPQDVIALQRVLWQVDPTLVIETGVARGGSIMLLASLLGRRNPASVVHHCGSGVSAVPNVIGMALAAGLSLSIAPQHPLCPLIPAICAGVQFIARWPIDPTGAAAPPVVVEPAVYRGGTADLTQMDEAEIAVDEVLPLVEGGKGTKPLAAHFQLRPDPLAK